MVEVRVPRRPTVFPLTDPGKVNEMAMGVSSNTLIVSINNAFEFCYFYY